jgi:hypothetical protein
MSNAGMKVIALFAVLACACFGEDVEVKPLTETQKKALAEVTAKLKAAQSAYDIAVVGVKAAHSVGDGSGPMFIQGCSYTVRTGEIVGGYIIIRINQMNRCTFTSRELEPIR